MLIAVVEDVLQRARHCWEDFGMSLECGLSVGHVDLGRFRRILVTRGFWLV